MINVRDYGATGDGVTDDTPFIQAAIAAASGQVLYMPAGMYKTTAELHVDFNRMSIRGDGPQLTTIAPALPTGQYGLTLRWDPAADPAKNGPFDAVSSLSFTGTGNALRVGDLETGGHAYATTIRDVGFNGFDVQVDLCNQVYLTQFDRCFFTNAAVFGVRMDDVVSSGENISFTNCLWSGGPGTGLYLNKTGASFYLEHCSFDYLARALWQRAGVVTMNACHFEAGTTYGGAGTEFLRLDRNGLVSRPMLTLNGCDFAAYWNNYDCAIRCAGTNGDQGLRVTSPYAVISSTSQPYLVRDDGPSKSNVVVAWPWYSRGDVPAMKFRLFGGADVTLASGTVVTQT